MMRMMVVATVSGILALSPVHVGNAAVPVTCSNCSSIAEQVRQAAMQARQYAQEVKGWVDVANSYATAVQNTVQLPGQVIGQATGLYYRVNNFATRATRLLESDAGLMQRLDMAQNLGSSMGRFPGNTVRSAEWWYDRAAEQWADNEELLGIEDERKAINQEMIEMAAIAGADAMGNLEIAQAQNMALTAMGESMNRISDELKIYHVYQMQKDADDKIRQAAYHQFMAGLSNARESEKAW